MYFLILIFSCLFHISDWKHTFIVAIHYPASQRGISLETAFMQIRDYNYNYDLSIAVLVCLLIERCFLYYYFVYCKSQNRQC